MDEELQIVVKNMFFSPGFVCAIPTNKKSMDTVWFLKMIREGITNENMCEKSEHCVIRGSTFIAV